MAFETGIVVFFRHLDRNDALARSVHPDGREVQMHDDINGAHSDDYVIFNEKDDIVGIYPREWVACILPLQTVGPADASSQQTGRNNPPAPAARDPESIAGRIEGIDFGEQSSPRPRRPAR